MILKTKSLPPEALDIIRDKGTEYPFTHDYQRPQEGTYLCRQCGLALFRGSNQFASSCGWPSFDEEISGVVRRGLDRDGLRTEILCERCGAHLGHVFGGEQYTAKNLRHCVNGLSLDFVADTEVKDSEEALFAAGCFWGVEYYFQQLPGVLKTEVGFSGGHTDHPSYNDVCRHDTGHYEVVRVVFDPQKISYEAVCQFFFELHDFTQNNGQGPDIGEPYLSRIFYYDENQKKIAFKLIETLKQKNYFVATQVLPVQVFWTAEDFHQDYYAKKGELPYCHRHTKVF